MISGVQELQEFRSCRMERVRNGAKLRIAWDDCSSVLRELKILEPRNLWVD
jgi:hypothetical protein